MVLQETGHIFATISHGSNNLTQPMCHHCESVFSALYPYIGRQCKHLPRVKPQEYPWKNNLNTCESVKWQKNRNETE